MYNAHRGMIPQPNNRLNELFEQLRQEFDNQSRTAGDYEHQVANQVQEMEQIRGKIYQLEQAQIKIKQDYENEIRLLRHELEARGGPPLPAHMAGAPHHGGPSQPPPPAVGHGTSNLFGGIMANQGQGGPGLAPPPHEQPPPSQHPLQPPNPAQQQPGPPPGQQPGSFPGYQPGPSNMNGYGPPQPAGAGSPGPGKPRSARGPQGPATPQQNQHLAYPDPRASPQVARPTPPGQPQGKPWPPVGNVLADLNHEELPPDKKRIGEHGDWYAVFNPEIPRVLDVQLVHSLTHESVVCCVRFSHDGKYIATGCNRSAQIFDVLTGERAAILVDESVDKEGDLYIRSVCFSPDGRYLATGAEDKLIRVWDIATRKIRTTFSGHEQDIYSLDFAKNGRHIASGSGDKTVRLWDIDAGQQVLVLSIEDGVTTVAMSPDGRYVAAGSLDRSVRVWDTTSGYLLERLEGPEAHQDSVYSVSFAPNGRDLVSGSLDKTIKMWELTPPRGLIPNGVSKSGRCVRTFEGHKDYVLSVCLTPNGEWVMSGSKDRGVQFWDPITGDAQMMLQGHKNSVISVAPCPTGNLFATGSGDMKARIWSYGPYNLR